ncbi:MAG: hypothetical protein LBF64_02445 [Oscillospiraceae bacterium]|jgi:hypothetical protein|nr:hypothetical protein [Oscillospiraceae bacterium]
MPLRGIDTQIMVTKSAEVALERTREMKQNELLAGQAAERARQQAQLDQRRPLAAGKVRGQGVAADGGGGPGGGGDAPLPRRRKEGAPPEGAHPAELEKTSTFDITV